MPHKGKGDTRPSPLAGEIDMAAGDGLHFSLVGSTAVMVDAVGPLTISLQQKIWALDAIIRLWPDVAETIIGVTNLMVVLREPERCDLARILDGLRLAWDALNPEEIAGRLVEIPVVYGGRHAIDLERVAHRAGMTKREVIDLHSAGEYTALTIASSPGFAYLHGLDERIHTPRKSVPALDLPAGSVTIGGMLTGVAVMSGPNGWNAIGRSSISFFDPQRQDPTFLKAGDRIRFVVEDILP